MRLRQRESAADRSVLDLVLDEAKTLRSKVGRADQQKLDEYLEGIRSVERRIAGDAKALNAGVKSRLERKNRYLPSALM